MSKRVRFAGLGMLLASLALGTALLAGSTVSAQTAPPTGAAPVIAIRSPSYSAGNVTVTGVAVDCRSGSPATRVAIYDTSMPGSPYVADVSMDTARDVGSLCSGRSGSARIGFTLIYDTRALAEGPHDLWFEAEFPEGATAGQVLRIGIENNPPYDPQCHDPNC